LPDRAGFVSSSFPLRIHLSSLVSLLLLLRIFLYLESDILARTKVVVLTCLHVLPFELPSLKNLVLLSPCSLTSFRVRQVYCLYLKATLRTSQAVLKVFLNDSDTHHVLVLLFQHQIKPLTLLLAAFLTHLQPHNTSALVWRSLFFLLSNQPKSRVRTTSVPSE